MMALSDLQNQAFTDCLKILEAVAADSTAACESGRACGMPVTTVNTMLGVFGSSAQPHEHRLHAGRVTASLLNSHKCQRTSLRSAPRHHHYPPQRPGQLHCIPCARVLQTRLICSILGTSDTSSACIRNKICWAAAGKEAVLIAWLHN